MRGEIREGNSGCVNAAIHHAAGGRTSAVGGEPQERGTWVLGVREADEPMIRQRAGLT